MAINGVNQGSSQTEIAIAIAGKSCLACSNYRSTHPKTKTCYCLNASRTVFDDSGCDDWNNFHKSVTK